MCYFLAVGVPNGKEEQLERVFLSDFQLRATQNPQAVGAFPAEFRLRLVTTGFCSCDLFDDQRQHSAAEAKEQFERKFQKRGWGKSKIERAVQQAEQSRSRTPPRDRGLRHDVVDRLYALAVATGVAGAFVHWFSGEIETEPLKLTRLPTCGLFNLGEMAASLREDHVLIVKNSVPELSGGYRICSNSG